MTPDSMSHQDAPPVNRFSRALWYFSPQWFLIPQGTGIIAVILHQLHYQFGALPIIARIIWIYTIVLYSVTLALCILRTFIHTHHVMHELRTNLLETSCLASISITFTSIIEMVSLQYGSSAALTSYILWCISTALAILAVIAIPYTQLKLQPPGIEDIPPSILLPVIATLTSAAGGGVICTYSTISFRLQVPAIIISYLEIGTGFALALAFSAIVLLEHFNRANPIPQKVYQDMILCGPFSQGGFALQALGNAVLNGSFESYNRGVLLTADAAYPIGYISQWAGLVSWGFSTFWWLFAIVSIVHTLLVQKGGWRATRFSMTCWSLVFPWGVYTSCAVQLGRTLNSPALHVWSTILAVWLVVVAIGVSLCTLKVIVTGQVFGLENGWRRSRLEVLDRERGKQA